MSVPCEMLLHPELLSNEQLICIIQERHLRVPNIVNMRRDELLDIFHHYCVPYGQRKYRDTGRGKLLNKTRQPSPESTKKLNIINTRETKHSKGNPNCDRLKPPLDFLTNNVKRIKLETTISPITNSEFLNMSKRKNTIDSGVISLMLQQCLTAGVVFTFCGLYFIILWALLKSLYIMRISSRILL